MSPVKKTHDIIIGKRFVNLAYQKIFIIRSNYLSAFITSAVVVFLIAFAVSFAQAPTTATSTASSPEEERQILEQQLEDLESQISEYEKTITEYRQQGNTLKSEIGRLEAEISKLNLQVKAININLEKLDKEIKITQGKISDTENKIETRKESLAGSIRKIYETDNQSLVEILIANNNLSDFFGDINNILLIQESLRVALNEVIDLRGRLLEEKEELSLQYDDAESLRAYQLAQRQKVQTTQSEKNGLLQTTKGKESEYQKLLQKTQETAAEIRKRIFRLLGGGELTFEEAYQYARLAEKATGVRASLILAILDRESLFGKNVGRCSYKTAMHPTRDVPYFLDLVERLKIDPNSEFAKVSCPISQHGSYGGAMGPAQFIPSTWKLYEKAIAAVTGNNPPNPWNNADAFAATAVYLKDLLNSSSCKSYAETNKHLVSYQALLERCAAAKYYSGASWYTYRFWYGEPVVSKANEFEKDITILNS